jgi:hypothetical protein
MFCKKISALIQFNYFFSKNVPVFFVISMCFFEKRAANLSQILES